MVKLAASACASGIETVDDRTELMRNVSRRGDLKPHDGLIDASNVRRLDQRFHKSPGPFSALQRLTRLNMKSVKFNFQPRLPARNVPQRHLIARPNRPAFLPARMAKPDRFHAEVAISHDVADRICRILGTPN